MTGLNDLQDKYDALTKIIETQNRLRDSGSDDYDSFEFDRAIAERDHVSRSIEAAGAKPGKRPTTETTKPSGAKPSGGKSTSTPVTDPSVATSTQLQKELDVMRAKPPHPGVKFSDGKVVGGTEADLKEQLKWRADVEKLEHELNAAQADEAWTTAGGAEGFTDADRREITRERGNIDGIQTELDGVNAEIAKKEALLSTAQGQLDGAKGTGGGPGAASGAAIAVGARIQGELRVLHSQKAKIIKRLIDAQAALANIIRNRVRHLLEKSGTRVDLPDDRKGQSAVEDAFLRRVYRRLGLPYPAPSAPGLLKGLGGPQSSRPPRRTGILVVATIVIFALIAFAVMAILSGDKPVEEVAIVIPPVSVDSEQQPAQPQTPEVSEDDVSNGALANDAASIAEDPPTDQVVDVIPVANATMIFIPYGCPIVIHSPLVGFSNSLSHFLLYLVVVGINGPPPPQMTVTVDAGGLAPNSAPVIGYVAEVPIPIDAFGSYPVASISASGPDGPLPVEFDLQEIVIGSAEGPVDGCLPPEMAQSANPNFMTDIASGMWFGDELAGSADEPDASQDPDTPASPDFAAFLESLAQDHAASDMDALLSSVDVATIDRYGEQQCRSYLEGVVGSFQNPVLLEATAAPWDYVTDAVTTFIPEAWQLDIDVLLGGSQTQTSMHVREIDGTVTWFSDCGTPINDSSG